MNYFLYYNRTDVSFYLECQDWHERFSGSHQLFEWVRNHMGPGDTLHWVEE